MVRLTTACGLGLLVMMCVGSVAQGEALRVGDKAPDFTAESVDGKTVTLADTKGSLATVLCFTCNDCPVAIAYEDRFIDFTQKYADKNVKFIAINVNKNENLEVMRERAEQKKFNFVYAYDQEGDSARSYGARVTPHLFLIDADGHVAYVGAFDDNMAAGRVKERHVESAVDALLAGRQPEVAETKAVGCTIKWK
jgi:peroxiredoxin